jgi:hypothetical protein
MTITELGAGESYPDETKRTSVPVRPSPGSRATRDHLGETASAHCGPAAVGIASVSTKRKGIATVRGDEEGGEDR